MQESVHRFQLPPASRGTTEVKRRSILAAGLASLGTLVLKPLSASPGDEASASGTGVNAGFPSQDSEVVREVVGASHGRLDRLRELVEPRPELARAAWDWGFGDWESALGAASHVGNVEIAEYLMRQGARPNLFTAAMMGQLEAVRGMVAMHPGVQRQPGPHGITLLAHAKAGGERAQGVVDYLEELGDADLRPKDLPLDDAEGERYTGTYRFGEGEEDWLRVEISRRGPLSIGRGTGPPRMMLHQGKGEFHPAGAPSARIRFRMEGGRAGTLEILNPERVLVAAYEGR